MRKAPREITNAMTKAISSGDLVITDKNGKEVKDDSFCDVCNKNIGDCLNAYSYHIIVSEDKTVLEEKLFCTKKCWNEYLVREAEKMK